MTATSTDDTERDVEGVCEDGRCIDSRIQATELSYCVRCDSTYCSHCWALQGPHRPKKRGPEGLPHEKVDLGVIRRLKGILNPSTDPLVVQKSHQEDEWTKWFGVTRDKEDQVLFDDYGRYLTLVSDIARSTSMKTRYPQLVSFVGVTNAGKSTLIKMLVHGGHGYKNDSASDFRPPSLVALSTIASPPQATSTFTLIPQLTQTRCPSCTPIAKASKGANDLLWARSLSLALKKAKVPQQELGSIRGGSGGQTQKSIVDEMLNGSHPGIESAQWDSSHATQSLLSSVSNAFDRIEGVARFRQLADHWRGLGREINSVNDLILCYYASFKVVRIPAAPQYMLISQQVDKLHAAIHANCRASHEAKRRARLLLDADELNLYI
ncbi:hypothetical protein WHR41_09522 [Cladosporium halotolerans]|uniref:G domain-containing protein n=1 Tax=Cladosporium halotolerans TaxID=1052096 RepID=A0AB34KFQ9_9PEZI